MPKKSGVILISLGAVLILEALLLFLHNRSEDRRAGQEAESLLEDARSAMAADTDPEPQEELAEEITYDYAGVITIPDLSLELPVIDQWSYARLKVAPCRQFGSSRTDDLVIAAHNYENHFGRLKELTKGDTVIFTDMEGIVNTYSVEKIETLKPDEVDAVQNSGYDLVLYTCTKGGKTRVTVFCNRAAVIAPSPIPTQTEK